ncbi:hypothetical protein AMK59_2433 [Oryctes borbonicus]|uniref:SHSP domain-containing protein n=1 Tax=Oryctes borbonicus TaxID=1629725 RepID=A0A0T6BC92_9SCAR|nr:hypothetical protein AMK59_2433 [Oryctes borbonicus]
MSLLPLFFEELHPFRPSRLLDQHFGLGLHPEDLTVPFDIPQTARAMLRCPPGYYRPWRSQAGGKDTGSVVTLDKDKFQVNLDVQHFTPNEITVKVTGKDTITVEGKHEEKQDEHGYISRQFVRKYVLPENHDIDNIHSKLSSDGVLTITAPKVSDSAAIEHRTIPIHQTGAPSKSVEPAKTEDKQN